MKRRNKGNVLHSKARNRMRKHNFLGVDGEGYTEHDPYCLIDEPCGKDCHHRYMCLLAGDRTLYTGQPLTGLECLAFIADLPARTPTFYVSYFFDYDVTMILKDMFEADPDLVAKLFSADRDRKLVWWRGFGIEYHPKKHLKVKRWTDDDSAVAVTIHDVQSFFQCSFVTALEKYNVGTPEQRAHIAEMKAARDVFSPDDADDIIAYSRAECVLMCDLAATVRDAAVAATLNAYPYEGPGYLATSALQRYYGKTRHQASLANIPEGVWDYATRAYYGGRFEITAHGPIKGKVWEYDIKSAYPAAMRELPCLVHGRWVHNPTEWHGVRVYVAHVRWYDDGSTSGSAMPFPVRRKNGTIYYPPTGEGWYWNHEVDIAECPVEILDCWAYIPDCDCRPFEWVNRLYEQRMELEHNLKGSGLALKLALNSLYGKCAQRKPTLGPWFNPVYAGLITSHTRAKVYNVYLRHVGSTVMFATDAVFLTEPDDELVLGENLGEWELGNGGRPFTDLAIFQPGVYFDGVTAAFKTRGVPKKLFVDYAPILRSAAADFDISIPVYLTTHMGLRLGLHRNAPRVGDWVTVKKEMSATPVSKRSTDVEIRFDTRWSWPRPNDNPGGLTVPYAPDDREVVDNMMTFDDAVTDGLYDSDLV